MVVDRTAISNVVPETNSLTYRGYPVQELAASRTFEEVAYLIWHGELPTAAELAELTAAERSQRELSRSTSPRSSGSPTTATRWTCCAAR